MLEYVKISNKSDKILSNKLINCLLENKKFIKFLNSRSVTGTCEKSWEFDFRNKVICASTCRERFNWITLLVKLKKNQFKRKFSTEKLFRLLIILASKTDVFEIGFIQLRKQAVVSNVIFSFKINKANTGNSLIYCITE